MPGPVALVGAGEFLAPMAEFDRGLLAATGRPRPRVVILPTASAPDGESTFRTWADMGVEHFAALGAEVEPVLVRDVAEGHDGAALQAIGEADLVYLSGGHPRHLLAGAARVADGAGARRPRTRAARSSPGAPRARWRSWAGRWTSGSCRGCASRCRSRSAGRSGSCLVDGIAVLPHYDAWPEPLSALVALQAPRGSVVLGIDEETAVVGRNGAWQVHGAGRVTVWRGRHRERFRKGDAFRL